MGVIKNNWLKRVIFNKAIIVASSVFIIAFGINTYTSAPVYNGAVSKHFDGSKFSNLLKSDKSPWDIITFFSGFMFYKQSWPGWVENDPNVVGDVVARSEALRVTFINHSSFLIQVDNLNILTDPVYSDRVSPFPWAGPKRVRLPGVAFEELPLIDVVIISHNHYDHLDIEALKKLYQRQQASEPLILAGFGNGGLFSEEGLTRYKDLDWGQSIEQGGVRFNFVESRHRSGRGISDQMKTLWGSFVMQTSMGPIYFAGDTGYGPHFSDAYEQFGEFYLSLLPIGAYEPRWFMKDIHLNPEEAVKAHIDLHSSNSLSMHFGTFQLTHEGINKPVKDLATALREYEMNSDEFRVLGFGETKTY